jgi:hypothetical protein
MCSLALLPRGIRVNVHVHVHARLRADARVCMCERLWVLVLMRVLCGVCAATE